MHNKLQQIIWARLLVAEWYRENIATTEADRNRIQIRNHLHLLDQAVASNKEINLK